MIPKKACPARDAGCEAVSRLREALVLWRGLMLSAGAGRSDKIMRKLESQLFLTFQGLPLGSPANSERFPMAKATTIKVKLVSSADTGFYYVTKKNSRTMTDKIVKKKYDPVAKKHVEFREAKIK
jgi:large subunit ribosomal protein L33